MTNRNASREQAIALWLAKVMGLWHPRISGDKVAVAYAPGTDAKPYFDPHHDRAQWAEVIEWSAMNGYYIGIDSGEACAAPYNGDGAVECGTEKMVSHDNTPAGVRAATLEAICLATGWTGMEGE